MQLKKPLYTVPVPSVSFTKEAYFDERGHGISPAIRFEYETDGVLHQVGIAFTHAATMRHRVERCCKSWHSDDCYDVLVEVENSLWVAEIRADTQEMWRDKWEMHHYMIYLDSSGCFEVIAESWSAFESPQQSISK